LFCVKGDDTPERGTAGRRRYLSRAKSNAS
jgi:hypothetical protein